MFTRRVAPLFYLGCVLVMVPMLTLYVYMNQPDFKQEHHLQNHMSELIEKLRHAEMINLERKKDILTLKHNLAQILEIGFESKLLGTNDSSKNTEHLLQETYFSLNNHILDLQLPSIYQFLPHLLKHENSLKPSLKLSNGRTGASIVLGIPSVKREFQNYLSSTLDNLIANISPSERSSVLIIVLIAESDPNYIALQSKELRRRYQEHLDSGLLEVIAPPESYYPEFTQIVATLGDPLDRVKWRTKQNLDFSYLMMYAQPRGTYYVQLEDDILTKPGYIQIMQFFIQKQFTNKREWMILDFCQLGFIGKMFKSVDLSKLVLFFIMFHNDKPVDWLLDHLIQTKVCRFDKDNKDCKKRKDSVWIQYKPSLFQHIGTHSSLRGKVQKLKDKQFGKVMLHVPHQNPPAFVSSSIKPYRSHNLKRAYMGETFFWGLLPQAGDILSFNFTPPVEIEEYLFRSGNLEHPKDRFFNTSVEILPESNSIPLSFPRREDGYYIIGKFSAETGIAQGKINSDIGPLKALRLYLEKDSDHWSILSEIFLKTGNSNDIDTGN